MLPPGPRTPTLWQSIQFLLKPKAYNRRLAAKFGETIRFRTLMGTGIAFANPEHARQVFAADPDMFEQVEHIAHIFGPQAVIATAGAVHKKQRKLLNPRFHGARVRAFHVTMQRVVREHLEAFGRAAKNGEVVVMADLAQAMTLDIIIETIFGSTDEVDRERARRVLTGLMQSITPIIAAMPRLHHRLYPPYRRFRRARAEFDAFVDDLVAARRAQEDAGADILGTLIEARYDDGSTMDEAAIRDQLLTLLLAGHETTAIGVAWGVYWLLREPGTLARLRAEVDALGPQPDAEALARLPYLAAVGAESLRIDPIVTDVARVCRRPLQVGPWTVPAGELAVVNIQAILGDPRLFPEPDRFRPERFLDRRFSVGEFMPFGGGARRCLGAAFAEAELAIALGTIVSEWDLALASDAPERSVRRNITMGPRHGVRLEVRGRRTVPGRVHGEEMAGGAKEAS